MLDTMSFSWQLWFHCNYAGSEYDLFLPIYFILGKDLRDTIWPSLKVHKTMVRIEKRCFPKTRPKFVSTLIIGKIWTVFGQKEQMIYSSYSNYTNKIIYSYFYQYIVENLYVLCLKNFHVRPWTIVKSWKQPQFTIFKIGPKKSSQITYFPPSAYKPV